MKHLTLAAVLTVAVLPLQAQKMHDFGYISATNPWLGSSNASGLVTFDGGRIAVAEAGLEKADGKYTGIEGSDNSLKGSLGTSAYATISDRLNAYGSLSYSYFMGQNMGGPILMDPSYNPISLIEYDETTTGRKSRELYRLEGAMSYKLSDRWSVGTSLNYESGLTAKRKDPRFRNIWMDMDFSIGGRFAVSDNFALGIAALYTRTLEKLDGSIYGETSIDYFNIIDYGSFWGKRELMSGDYGYVPVSSSARNMLNNFYGASLQLQFGKGEMQSFHEISWKMRSGYYGIKGTSSIVYTEHDGNELNYSGVLIFKALGGTQKTGLELAYLTLNNRENVFRTSTKPGQSTIVEMLGSKDVLERSDISGRLYWQGWSGIGEERADWEYSASLDGTYRAQTTTIYPYYRSSQILTAEALLRCCRNIRSGKHIISPELGTSFRVGGGNPKQDGTLANSTSDAPLSADGYLLRDFEYRSIAAAGVLFGLAYTRTVKGNLDAYIKLTDHYLHCIKEPQYIGGRGRNIINLTIGCTF